jgi:hypothetical protein
MRIDYEDYEKYYDDLDNKKYSKNYKKNQNKNNNYSKKGHQSRHQKRNEYWDKIEAVNDPDNITFSPQPKDFKPKKEFNQTLKYPSKNDSAYSKTALNEKPKNIDGKPQITFGPNTHTIKGNSIDFDRVINIEKVQNEFNGKLTYGIKFNFLSKKGSSRTVWFNRNIQERDTIYTKEVNFWQGLTKRSS